MNACKLFQLFEDILKFMRVVLSYLLSALTEAENILVMKKASENTYQSGITNFLSPNVKNDQ